MQKESVYRGTAATLIVTAASISVYHRHKSEKAGEEDEISFQDEGLPVAIALRSSGLVL